MSELKINFWLGCHASYNDGYLFDKQYSASDSSEVESAIEDFQSHVLKCIKKERPEWVKDGYINDETYAEELYLADYETYLNDKFIETDFGESIQAMQAFLDDASRFDDLEIAMAVAKNNGVPLSDVDLDEVIIMEIEHKSESEVGHALAELTCVLDEMPKHLQDYFDYEAYGRDALYDGAYYIETSDSYYVVMG